MPGAEKACGWSDKKKYELHLTMKSKLTFTEELAPKPLGGGKKRWRSTLKCQNMNRKRHSKIPRRDIKQE